MLAVTAGCPDSQGLVNVTGSVKYPDGTVPKGLGTSYVSFVPEDLNAPKARGASGIIDPETGEFELYTVKPGDGATPGKYRVTLKIDTAYPPKPNGASSLVPPEYNNPEKTPLTAEISSSQKRFDFEVPKKGAAKKK